MKRFARYLFFFCGLSFMLFFSSCGPLRPFGRRNIQKEVAFLFDEASGFKAFESKVSFRIQSNEGQNLRFSGQIKMAGDSCLLISIQPFLGIEAARIMLRQDSFFVLNRLQKEYLAETYPVEAPWTGRTMIALFSNRVFKPLHDEKAFSNDFDIRKEEGGGHRLHYPVRISDLSWKQYLSSVDFYINAQKQYERMIVSGTNENLLGEVFYEDFRATDFGFFPNQLTLTWQEQQGKSHCLFVHYTKPTFKNQMAFDFSIKENYRKTTLANILSSLIR